MPDSRKGSKAAGGAPRNQTLDALRRIWIEALEHDINDETLSFFDNGGDSLGATIVLSRVNFDFGIEVSLEDFFDYPTLDELAVLIESKRGI